MFFQDECERYFKKKKKSKKSRSRSRSRSKSHHRRKKVEIVDNKDEDASVPPSTSGQESPTRGPMIIDLSTLPQARMLLSSTESVAPALVEQGFRQSTNAELYASKYGLQVDPKLDQRDHKRRHQSCPRRRAARSCCSKPRHRSHSRHASHRQSVHFYRHETSAIKPKLNPSDESIDSENSG